MSNFPTPMKKLVVAMFNIIVCGAVATSPHAPGLGLVHKLGLLAHPDVDVLAAVQDEREARVERRGRQRALNTHAHMSQCTFSVCILIYAALNKSLT